jgi:hypothetical protein
MIVIPHGDMVLHDDENTSEGALANITCDDGYDSDKPTIECLNNGKWENATCHPKGFCHFTLIIVKDLLTRSLLL